MLTNFSLSILTLFLLSIIEARDFQGKGALCPTQIGRCSDTEICLAAFPAKTVDACEYEFSKNKDPAACTSYTFDSEAKTCTFFNKCDPPVACDKCLSGEKCAAPRCNEAVIWQKCKNQFPISAAVDYNDCSQQCADLTTSGQPCTHFTFVLGSVFQRKPACLKYDECTSLDFDGCNNCVSSESTCGNLECLLGRCCKGDSLGNLFGVTLEQCVDYCNKNVTECKWFSYYKELEGCVLTGDTECVTNGEPDGTCISGQKSCQSTTPICNEDSCCADTTLAASLVTSEDACLKKCKTFPVVDGKECKWYSFVKDVRFCLLFSTTCKDKIDGGEGVCSSGDKNCPTAKH